MNQNKLDNQKIKDIFEQTVNKNDELQILEYNEVFNCLSQIGLNLQNNIKENEKLYKQYIENKYKYSITFSKKYKKGLSLNEFIDFSNKIYQEQIMNEMNFQQFQIQRPMAFYGLSMGVFKVGEKIVDVKFLKNNQDEIIEDELEQIKDRIDMGYGLNSLTNLKLFQKLVKQINQQIEFNNDDFNLYTELNDFWEWIQKCILFKVEQTSSNSQGGFKWKNMVDPASGFKNIIDVEKEQNQLPRPNHYLIFGHLVCETDRRIQALNICGWQELYMMQNNRHDSAQNTPEKKLTSYLDQLVTEQQYSKAVAIAVFHFDYSKAYEYLNKMPLQQDDSVSFMKGILKGLDNIQIILEKDQNLKNFFYQKKDSKNVNNNDLYNSNNNQSRQQPDNKSELENLKKNNIFDVNFQADFMDRQDNKGNPQLQIHVTHSLQFIKNMCQSTSFKDPYFKAICNFISNNQSNILYELRIPLFDRLAFAIRFYDTKKLEQLFQNYEEAAKQKGILGTLILTGQQSLASQEILQKYLDIKSDIQTVGLSSIYLRIFKIISEKKQVEWYQNYIGLINRLHLWKTRTQLDKQYNQLIETYLSNETKNKEINQTQIAQKCNFCNCKNDHQTLLQKLGPGNKGYATFRLENRVESNLEKALLFNCPKCLKPLPNCEICLLPISIANPYIEIDEKRKGIKSKTKKIYENTNLNDALIWCQNCKHGGHYKHIMDWFMIYNICPVSDCDCECALL